MENDPETQVDVTTAETEDAGAVGLQQEESPYGIKNIEWVTCEDFTIDVGKEHIKQYMHTWEIDSKWLYRLTFVEEKEEEFHKVYYYRVMWSVPTPSVPIPKSTASVYFVIKISKIKPQNLPVEVSFLVESNRLIHRPGKTRFREKWLQDIIESKAVLQEAISF